jgi:hypothetical protein
MASPKFETLSQPASTGKSRISQQDIIPAAVKTRNVFIPRKGKGYIQIDHANNRIIINDGTTDRILLGFQEDGF